MLEKRYIQVALIAEIHGPAPGNARRLSLAWALERGVARTGALASHARRRSNAARSSARSASAQSLSGALGRL
jgi:hypothetical protein